MWEAWKRRGRLDMENERRRILFQSGFSTLAMGVHLTGLLHNKNIYIYVPLRNEKKKDKKWNFLSWAAPAG